MATEIISIYGYHVTFSTYLRHRMPQCVVSAVDAALCDKMTALGVAILEHKVMPDHVHIYLPPVLPMPLPTLIGQLKGYISRVVRLQCPDMAYWRKLWGGGYFVKTVDKASYDVHLRKYIRDN